MIVSDCSAIEHLYNKHTIAETPEDAARIGIQSGVNMECGPCYKNALLNAVKQYKVTEENLDKNVTVTLRTKFRLGLFEKENVPAKINWNQQPEYRTEVALALAKETAVKGCVSEALRFE